MVKILHYYLLTLMLLMLSIGARAEDKTVTINKDDLVADKTATSLTKEGITISIDNGSLNNGVQYFRVYSKGTITISCSAGNITKITFTTTYSTAGPDRLSLSVGGGQYTKSTTKGEWVGDATTVSFRNITSKQAKIEEIVVTYSTGSSAKQEPNLAFSTQTATAALGLPFTAPTLTKPENLAVSYSSSNTNVATVNASTGEVTALSAGTTTITAKSEETDTYLAGEASYTLTVLALTGNGSVDYPYTVADLKALAAADMLPTSPVSVKGIISSVYSFYYGAMYYYISDDDATANQLLVAGYNLGGIRFSAKEDLMVGSKVILTGTPYDESEFDYTEITSIEVPVSIVDGEYATFYYGGFNLKIPAGVTATTYSYANNALTTSKTYNEGDVIPAKTAVVLKANEGDYFFAGTTETGERPTATNLHGSDVETWTNVEGMGKYYMLSLNAQSDPASIGFYWGADGGGAFTSKAHKAYLALPASANVKGFAFNDVTNGITAKTTTEQADAPVYSLTGLRMSGPLPAGVYVRNGKKFIVK